MRYLLIRVPAAHAHAATGFVRSQAVRLPPTLSSECSEKPRGNPVVVAKARCAVERLPLVHLRMAQRNRPTHICCTRGPRLSPEPATTRTRRCQRCPFTRGRPRHAGGGRCCQQGVEAVTGRVLDKPYRKPVPIDSDAICQTESTPPPMAEYASAKHDPPQFSTRSTVTVQRIIRRFILCSCNRLPTRRCCHDQRCHQRLRTSVYALKNHLL